MSDGINGPKEGGYTSRERIQMAEERERGRVEGRLEATQLRADAELGRLVRRLPAGTALRHCTPGEGEDVFCCEWSYDLGSVRVTADTPERALASVAGEEGDPADPVDRSDIIGERAEILIVDYTPR